MNDNNTNENRDLKGEQLPIEVKPSIQIEREANGHFKKGVTPNPLGRTKGSVTRKTAILQKFTDDILNGGAERFKEELHKLKGKDFCNFYLALLEYSLPKKSRVEYSSDNDEMRVIQVFKIGSVEITL